jgi:hypothetical protein
VELLFERIPLGRESVVQFMKRITFKPLEVADRFKELREVLVQRDLAGLTPQAPTL